MALGGKIFMTEDERRAQRQITENAARFNHHMKEAAKYLSQIVKDYQRISSIGKEAKDKTGMIIKP